MRLDDPELQWSTPPAQPKRSRVCRVLRSRFYDAFFSEALQAALPRVELPAAMGAEQVQSLAAVLKAGDVFASGEAGDGRWGVEVSTAVTRKLAGLKDDQLTVTVQRWRAHTPRELFDEPPRATAAVARRVLRALRALSASLKPGEVLALYEAPAAKKKKRR
jgi:hypothetical protein